MSPQTIEALNQLNKLFYSENAVSFGATRQHSWVGWQELLGFIPHTPFSLLDIGCGNGRFEAFMRQKQTPLSSYMGIDSSLGLLEDASKQTATKYQRAFKQVDIVMSKTWLEMPKTFDVIVMLAVLHHVPSRQLRQEIFMQAAGMLKPGGMLIVSVWHYETDARFRRKLIPWDQATTISQSELEVGDNLLSWNNDQNKKRYVHVFTDLEIEGLVHSSGLTQVKAFYADGKNQQLNQYLVLRRERGTIKL